jgi:hypothetical protein
MKIGDYIVISTSMFFIGWSTYSYYKKTYKYALAFIFLCAVTVNALAAFRGLKFEAESSYYISVAALSFIFCFIAPVFFISGTVMVNRYISVN